MKPIIKAHKSPAVKHQNASIGPRSTVTKSESLSGSKVKEHRANTQIISTEETIS